MMIFEIAFILYLGKLFSWIYYCRQKNCKKIANANFIEMVTYGLIAIVAYITGV